MTISRAFDWPRTDCDNAARWGIVKWPGLGATHDEDRLTRVGQPIAGPVELVEWLKKREDGCLIISVTSPKQRRGACRWQGFRSSRYDGLVTRAGCAGPLAEVLLVLIEAEPSFKFLFDAFCSRARKRYRAPCALDCRSSYCGAARSTAGRRSGRGDGADSPVVCWAAIGRAGVLACAFRPAGRIIMRSS